ncbi:MAG TPA: hypothetical protein PKY82_03505 [Pyrinomonadaceae bacterium]|nr:hypothetical protein [Pyrinomonadaceae bacterium]
MNNVRSLLKNALVFPVKTTFFHNQFNFANLKDIFYILSGLLLIIFLVITNFAQELTPKEDEVIKINTELVQVNFPYPKDPTAPIRVFENKKEITDFVLTKPTEDKLSLVVIFDFVPCRTKKECRSLNKLGEYLRTNLNNLRDAGKINFVISTENLEPEDVERMIDFKKSSINVENFNAALISAEKIFRDQKRVRQSLLIITNRIDDLKDVDLANQFESSSGYVEIISTKKGSKSGWMGWNNLGLPGMVMQDNGNNGYVFDLQLSEFVDLANSLHAISFQKESEGPADVSIKTYSKIWGEQNRSRPYKITNLTDDNLIAKKQLESNTKDVIAYYDEDLQQIGKSIKTFNKITPDKLLPAISKRLVSLPAANEKIRNSMQWLRTKYKWDIDFPFVVFEFNKPYVGIQDVGKLNFEVIAFSTKSLELLSEEELAGVIAHEIVHIILKNEPESAALEEKCDLIAALILPTNLKTSLFSALDKLTVEGDLHHQSNRSETLSKNLSILQRILEKEKYVNSEITSSIWDRK